MEDIVETDNVKIIDSKEIPEEIKREAIDMLEQIKIIKQGELFIISKKKLQNKKKEVKRDIEDSLFVYVAKIRMKALEYIENAL